ncbi:MAG: hypothetical protein LH606_18270, partial [Cytophagaceae bacterium]|nr:hypothetical protein [Cytophagaceae bacterium]
MKKPVLTQTLLRKIMRVTVTQLLLSVLCCGLALAYDAHAQEILSREVSIQVEGADVRQVLNSLAQQANVKFVSIGLATVHWRFFSDSHRGGVKIRFLLSRGLIIQAS